MATFVTQNPTMQSWTNAWFKSDTEGFKNLYAAKALIFPPNKSSIQGNTHILDFMKGGFGKIEVIFIAEDVIVSDKLLVESGVFNDLEVGTQNVVGEGTYAVIWVLENDVWKIQCHTWSMTQKK